ncbi:hypothetical protein Hypma_013385 [Hypsizygus marmoreus]|uniref:Transcription elongation factor Eaf N-terminal domain-containing protein n=1 Tax=Hypsizygus marmoreus TaxID=39966 RepID=A0A369JE05_HYPMA|nr:hypothetical protein Hypma_013385 [Hypsizygus marmoreus]
MSNSWMPPAGRRNVDVGSSLSRALKARKGDAPPQRARHVRDFYSFRYNFKPSSIDPGERGKISIKKGKEHSTVEVERPGIQPGDAFMFTGQETQAKEWDCVLIYDDVSDTYTLEKLDSYVTLKYDRKASAEHTDSPAAPTPPVQPSKPDTKDDQEPERSADADVDADGDFDADFEEIIPTSIARREEEEEDEDPVITVPPTPKEPKPARDVKVLSQPLAPPPAPAVAPAPKPAPAQKLIPTLPVPRPRQSAASTTKSKPVPLPRAKKHKRDPEPVALSNYLSDADEEDLEFGKPAKRARPSPPSNDLALPSVSASVYTPPPPVVRQPSPPPPPAAVLSESEEEWDEVAAVGNVKGTETEDDFDIFGDAAGAEAEGEGGEDIDVNELEREINLQMDEDSDEDFLAAVVEEAPTSLPARGGPISLKELAGGAAYASEDEYSSSDESDDD